MRAKVSVMIVRFGVTKLKAMIKNISKWERGEEKKRNELKNKRRGTIRATKEPNRNRRTNGSRSTSTKKSSTFLRRTESHIVHQGGGRGASSDREH